MKKNYDQHKVTPDETECSTDNVSAVNTNKETIMTALKRLLGKDKEHDIHDLSEFAWP